MLGYLVVNDGNSKALLPFAPSSTTRVATSRLKVIYTTPSPKLPTEQDLRVRSGMASPPAQWLSRKNCGFS